MAACAPQSRKISGLNLDAPRGLPWWLSSKEFTCHARDADSIPGLGRSLEKEMATHSSILAWEIPCSNFGSFSTLPNVVVTSHL